MTTRHYFLISSQTFLPCNANCNCDFVQYSPVCGGNDVTYISSCHAGCSGETTLENGTKLFTNCRCINATNEILVDKAFGGSATSGACPIDCMPQFLPFLIFLCIEKFIGGTEMTANFLLGIR